MENLKQGEIKMENLKQGTPEWLEMRKNYIGASDAPIVMGVSPFKRSDGLRKTPYVLWQEKLGLLPDEKQTFAMKYGSDMEEPARKEYEKMVGCLVFPTVVFHKEVPYMMASLDGLSSCGLKAVEIKNASAEDHEEAKNKRVPAKYYPQLQHQLACKSGIPTMDYFSFHKGEGVIVEVCVDKDYLEEMYAKEEEFWGCVASFTPPKLSTGDYHEKGEDWGKLAKAVFGLKSKRKSLEVEEKEAERLLKEASNGESSSFGRFRYTLGTRKGNVNYGNIPELSGVDLDLYRKESTSRWLLSHAN